MGTFSPAIRIVTGQKGEGARVRLAAHARWAAIAAAAKVAVSKP
jgi:hypothetical protein